jgi:hypothetical protein
MWPVEGSASRVDRVRHQVRNVLKGVVHRRTGEEAPQDPVRMRATYDACLCQEEQVSLGAQVHLKERQDIYPCCEGFGVTPALQGPPSIRQGGVNALFVVPDEEICRRIITPHERSKSRELEGSRVRYQRNSSRLRTRRRQPPLYMGVLANRYTTFKRTRPKRSRSRCNSCGGPRRRLMPSKPGSFHRVKISRCRGSSVHSSEEHAVLQRIARNWKCSQVR